jgi:hypothetical protein
MYPIGTTKLPGGRAMWAGYTFLNGNWGCAGYPAPQPYFPGGWPPGYPPPPGTFGQPAQVTPVPGEEPSPGQISPAPQGEAIGSGTDPFFSGQIGDTPTDPGVLGLSGQIVDTPTEEDDETLRTPLQPSTTRDTNPSRWWAPQRPQWRYAREPDRSHLTLHVANYPTPGMFFDANNPQGRFRFTDVDSFIRAALGSALRMAGLPGDLATSRAGEPLRKALSDAIVCGKYNDGLFGTTAVGFLGGRRWVGPHGRGINWEPHHADVRRVIASGKTPYRTTTLDGSRMPSYIESNHRPLVFIPELDLRALRNYRIVPTKTDPSIQKIDLNGVRFPGGVGCVQHTTGRNARDWWERR